MIFKVIIINKNHPLVEWLIDFNLHDEIYINIEIADDVEPLLGTDYCESAKLLGWTKIYKNSKILVYLSGHDINSFKNASFKKIISNGIRWLSNRKI